MKVKNRTKTEDNNYSRAKVARAYTAIDMYDNVTIIDKEKVIFQFSDEKEIVLENKEEVELFMKTILKLYHVVTKTSGSFLGNFEMDYLKEYRTFILPIKERSFTTKEIKVVKTVDGIIFKAYEDSFGNVFISAGDNQNEVSAMIDGWLLWYDDLNTMTKTYQNAIKDEARRLSKKRA